MITVKINSSFDIKQKCCGCGACVGICPKQCIEMKSDEEGFLYPEVNLEECINCGLCERTCPVLQVEKDEPFLQDAYIVQHKGEEIRKESTAGGAFTAIAEYVIIRGGVVFGAAYTDDFIVRHIGVDNTEELWRFRNSKYVQSQTETAFRLAKKFLEEGRWVCFSGTPCQIEGLNRFLKEEHEKLITVDVVCHAVPSPLVFEKYVKMQKQKYGNDISNILFREKHYGYKYSTMTVLDKFGKDVYAYGIDSDPMLRAFFSNVCDRPSCYDCKFKKRYRTSDFTIWDCYTVFEFNKEMDDDKGTTRVLIHSNKGREVFADIKDGLIWSAVNPDHLTRNVKEMFDSVNLPETRSLFMQDAKVMGYEELFTKWFPKNVKTSLNRFLRVISIKLGIYNVAKKYAKKIIFITKKIK